MEHPHPADGGADPGPGPWREPPRGGHPDAQLANRPGTELLQAMLDGTTPAPPLSRLTGMRLTEFAPGTATFALPLSPWLADATGMIPLGPLTIPADAAMACAVIAGLPAGIGLTTSELGLRQVRPIRPGGTVLLARGQVLHTGPPVALAEVTVTDEEGRLIAHGGSLCVTVPAQPAEAPAAVQQVSYAPVPQPPSEEAADGDAPDPWQRPLPPDSDGSPLGRLIGLRAVTAAPGEIGVALPATRWLCAPPPGRVQGGAVATLADAALTGAIDTADPGGTRFQPVELKLNFLRPLASDGREARAHGRLLHSGRRIAVASAEVLSRDGRLVAVATGSAVAVSPE